MRFKIDENLPLSAGQILKEKRTNVNLPLQNLRGLYQYLTGAQKPLEPLSR